MQVGGWQGRFEGDEDAGPGYKDGNMGKYKKPDFKYDVAAGFIKF